MLGCEDKEKSTVKPILTTSFVPRQLLLSSSSSMSTMAQQAKDNSSKTTVSLSPQDRIRLLHTICEFLKLNGFSKTLKKFHREANIEKDSLKNCSLSLEEMFQEYLQKCNDTNGTVLQQKDKNAKHVADVKTDKRTKETQVDDGKNVEATLENETVDGDDIKPMRKKKNKNVDVETHLKTSEDAVGDTLSEPAEAVKKSKKKKQKDVLEPSGKDLKEQPVADTLSVPIEPVKKSKDKKKKHKDETEVLDKNTLEKHAAEVAEDTSEKADGISKKEKKEKLKSKKLKEDISVSKDEVNEAGKGSKKRKKSSSDDNATGHVEERATDDSKRRKIDDSDESNGAIQPSKTPKATANGVSEDDDGEKDHKQEHNGSAEPTSAKAFQRVKAEEVKFEDDRLRDNSYWAKDGAESGYGAKAQEVLGQVRGRGFRHEKTKKKRGTYRGGQIDLQSHSIKFNYDDDDE